MTRVTFSNIRLGWLQRFCAVARHGSYVKAAEECNVDPTCVADSVQSLEKALGRMLIYATTARTSVMGRSFISRAETVLDLMNISTRQVTNLTVGSLESLIAFSESLNFVAAANSRGCTRYKIMREVKQLEYVMGDRIIVKQGRAFFITPLGERLLFNSYKIVELLKAFKNPEILPERTIKRRRRLPWFLRTFPRG